MKISVECGKITIRPSDTVARLIRSLTRVHRELGQEYQLLVQKGFENEKSPAGAPWKGLVPATVKKRGSAHPILRVSGRLAGTHTRPGTYLRADAEEAVVGSNLVYAAIHQYGGEIKRKGGMLKLHFKTFKRGPRKGRALFSKEKQATGKSSAEIAAMREDYAQAFNNKAIKDLNKELLQLEGNTRDLRDIKIEETMKKFGQGYASAGLSAKEAEPYMERVKKALVEQEDFKDLQTAADFYKELASLSGAYGASIEYQNRLIEKQAKAWELAGIAADDVKKRVDLMKEELSRDPYDGFVRGTRKWVSEATDGAKQIENLTTSALDGIADSFAELCLTGKASFSDLANSIIADLYRIASRQFIGGIVGGLMGSLGGLFGGGGYASSATSLVNMIPGAAFATGGVAAPSGLPRSGGLLTSPTFFSDGLSRAYASGGLSVAGEAGPEVFMPAARMSDGNYGVRVDMSAVSAQLRAGLSGTTAPNISINVINRTGGQVEAETQARPDGQGGFTLDILLTQVEQGLVARAKSGRSSLMQYQEKAYGLSRASVLTRGRGRA